MNFIELNNQVKIKDENGKYQFHKDKEAVKKYFIDEVNQNLVYFSDIEEKMDYLVDENYYDPKVLNMYSFNQVKKIVKLVYNKEFRFESFMSAFKFYNSYAMKTNDKKRFLEKYEDRIVMNALLLGDGKFEKAKEIAVMLIEQCVQPATPTFLNAGRARSGELVSCFLVDVMDSTEGIEYAKEAVAQLSRRGGGVGINLSKVRASRETIKDIEGCASGVVGVAKMIESTVDFYDQLGQRKGSAVVYLHCHHADLISFLETKKENADDKSRLKTLSLGVVVTDKMMELAKEGKHMFLFYPHTVYKEYGLHLDDMDMNEWYDKLVENKNVKKDKVDPREILNKIAEIQMESGYPYLIFIDNANKANALKALGRIIMSNLCSEIYQHSVKSVIRARHELSDYGKDISCNLASINIDPVMSKKLVREAVRSGMDGLNTVAKRTSLDVVQTIKNGNDASRSVGLGAMNLHGYLAKNKIMYASREAKDFANTFFMMMNFYSIERSMEIAIEDKFVFEGFEKTEYADGTYFKKYINNSFAPKTEKVKGLFEGMHIPTQEDWAELADKVAKNGLANGYRLALAPTG